MPNRARQRVRALLLLSLVIGCGRTSPPVADSSRADTSRVDSPRADAVLHSAAARANRERPDSERATPFAGDTAAKRSSSVPPGPNGLLRDVRTARHPGFDRVVFVLSGDRVPRWEVGYTRAPAQCGSGDAVRLLGGAALVVRLHGIDAHVFEGEQSRVTVAERERRPDLAAVKEMKQICDFEATVEWALGVDRARAFRVSSVLTPPRVIVDVETGP